MVLLNWAQSGLVVSKLDSRSKGCWFEFCLIQNTTWKWSTYKDARIDSCTQFWFIRGKNKKM